MTQDERYMRRALELATRARGHTKTNPLVGCVLVKEGRIIGEGYHRKYGSYHGEADAILNAREDVKGATAYLNLEPCSHYGKQPPCCKLLVERGIKRVVCSMVDPNPQVMGRGIAYLKDHGVEVEVGLLEEESRKLNKFFFHYIKYKRPYVRVKVALTLTGATIYKGEFFTGTKARIRVHEDRSLFSGIFVSSKTVIKDDPMLDTRLMEVKNEEDRLNPMRIILDSNIDIPIDSKIVKSAGEIKTLVLACEKSYEEKMEKVNSLKRSAVEIEQFKSRGEKRGRLNLKEVLARLGEMGINSLYCESPGEIFNELLNEDLVNELEVYIAPILGGEGALVKNRNIDKRLKLMERENLEGTIRLLYEVV